MADINQTPQPLKTFLLCNILVCYSSSVHPIPGSIYFVRIKLIDLNKIFQHITVEINSIEHQAFQLFPTDLQRIKPIFDTSCQLNTCASSSNNWLSTADRFKEMGASWIDSYYTKEMSWAVFVCSFISWACKGRQVPSLLERLGEKFLLPFPNLLLHMRTKCSRKFTGMI